MTSSSLPLKTTSSSTRILILALVVFVFPVFEAASQTPEQIRAQAGSQLQSMTPEQIDAKLREYGLTREEAEAKAKEYGVDLDTYIQQRSRSHSPSSSQGQTPSKTAAPLTTDDSTANAPVPSYQTPKTVESPKGPGGLPFFGYDVFSQPSDAFEPTASGPVDPDYLIGPEDVLRVTVWGQVELQHELTVDKEGRIFIPTIGQFMVSGLTLQEATGKIKAQMSRSYSGLNSSRPTTWLDVSIARLRPKRIYIMGEVKRPGGYTVSSYATVFSALYSVGGPTVKGSMRDIRVTRNGKTIAHVDLYDYLTGAEQTNDFRIQNNDIVFVPQRGRTVAITREIRKPAIYELKQGEHLKALLEFSGGVLSTAYLERVQIDRIIPFAERKEGDLERRVMDVDFRQILTAGKDYPLFDADSIMVFSILDLRKNIATITGAVWRPGQYQLEKAPTVRKLVELAGGLLEKAFTVEAHLIRYNSDEFTRSIEHFNLKEVLADPARDIILQKRDEVIVFSTEATEIKQQFVTLRGEVKSPGRYPLFANMRLRDLILAAGGYTDSAEVLEAEVARVRKSGLGGDTLALILHPSLPFEFVADAGIRQGDAIMSPEDPSDGQFLISNRDEILIRANPRYRRQQDVVVSGDIMYPGTYSLRDRTEKLSSLLARAGGPTSTSFLEGGQYYRNGKRVAIDFREAMRENMENDVIMMGGDSLMIPSKPRTVMVKGQVNHPGLFAFLEGDNVSEYIERAGGITDSASFAVMQKPTGESRKVKFGFLRSDPRVPEGSTIEVFKIPPEPALESKPIDVGGTIKDIFAILISAATLVFLAIQVKK